MKPSNPDIHRRAPAAAQRAPVLGGRYLWAASLAVAASTGWMARGAGQPADAPASPAASPVAAVAAATPATPVDTGPVIAVASDGRVTLRVEQQPLDWVLEQIGLQSGRAELLNGLPAGPQSASATTAARPAAPAATLAEQQACPSPSQADPARLMQTIAHGAEADRLQALMRARADGVALPGTLLKTLVETAPSDPLRLAALETWLERQPPNHREQRAALEAALLVPHAAVQEEARQRLDDLLEMERLSTPAGSGSP